MKFRGNKSYSFTHGNKDLLGCRLGELKRYTVLILFCLILLVAYYIYDVPGSLQSQIMEKYHLSSLQFSYLYSFYYWPNIVMCSVGGFLVDRIFGHKLGLIIFTMIATVGVALFVAGCNMDDFSLMLAGRFIFGLGCESAIVTVNSYIVVWFKEKELNMVYATVNNIGRVGSSLIFASAEPLFKYISDSGLAEDKVLPITLIASGAVILVALSATVFIALMEPEDNEINVSEKEKFSKLKKTPKIKISDIFSFPLQYWLLCIIFCFYINCLYSFLGLSQESLKAKFNISNATANSYVSFFNMFSFILSPFLGILIDRYGRNLSYITLAIFTGLTAFSILQFTEVNLYVSMVILSVSISSFLCSIFAMVSYVIPDHKLGTGFGMLLSFSNMSLSLGIITTGAISSTYGPKVTNFYFIALLVGALPVLLLLWIYDLKSLNLLNMSSKKRAEVFEKTSSEVIDEKRIISTISNTYKKEVKNSKYDK